MKTKRQTKRQTKRKTNSKKIKNNPKKIKVNPKKSKTNPKKFIKNSSDKLNVIFDIDETLIKSIFSDDEKRNFIEGVSHNTEYNLMKTKNGISFIYFIRNYFYLLFNYCIENFNVGIWSNGNVKYIEPLLKKLLTKIQYNKLTIIIGRNNKTDKFIEYIDLKTNNKFKINLINNKLSKPLSYLFNTNPYSKTFNSKNTILIDDTPSNISINPENSIYIPQYCLKNNDNYLFNVYQWLKKNKKKRDIRYTNKSIFTYKDDSNTSCFINDKYYFSSGKKLKIGDFVELKRGNFYVVGYIDNIINDKYTIIEFDEEKLFKNDFKFKIHDNIDSKNLKKITI